MPMNFSYPTISVPPSPATSGLSLTLDAGFGDMLPDAPFEATVWPAGTLLPLQATSEHLQVSAKVGDVLTIVRGTPARTIISGDQITAVFYTSLLRQLNALAMNGVSGGGGAGTETVGEVPTGSINGSNDLFTLADDAVAGTLKVYLNGLRQLEGDDYTVTTSSSFTMVNAPMTGDRLVVDYTV